MQPFGVDHGVGAQRPQRPLRPLDVRLKKLPQPRGRGEVSNAQADARHLVLVGGADPPPRRPQRGAAPALLLGVVEQLVIG